MAEVTKFLDQKSLAVVGVSRSGKKFSNILYKNLKSKGYQLFAVNPNTSSIGEEPCYADIQSIPQKVNGVVIVVKPNQTEQIVKEAFTAGIEHVWIQQGAQSTAAIEFCKSKGMNVIHHHCILMFADPTSLHKCHRYLWKVLKKLPK
ncbi:MAG: CoA-binding protein [Bacillales bacterium]|jgi:predicted CoA-binding protein|nr:CoA-binding protein [Bacillales bacterium]